MSNERPEGEPAVEALNHAIIRLNNELPDNDATTEAFQSGEMGMGDCSIHHPVYFAHLLMANLDGPDTVQEKIFWTRVADILGPDFIAQFRRIGAFMAAVDKA